MHYKVFLTLLLLQFSLSGISQTDVVSAGANATGANGKVSFSVGQTLYSNYASSSGNENQGVQQPYEIVSPAGIKPGEVVYDLSVFPNPAEGQLTLQSGHSTKLDYILYDSRGRLLANGIALPGQTSLDMSELAPALYTLKINNSQTFSILKR